MNANIGMLDRALRLGAGAALIAFGIYDETSMRWIGLLGPVLIITALVRFCPAYWLLKLKTIKGRAET
jgi:hypothetical protein